MTENKEVPRLVINPRLLKIAELVPPSRLLADIGTDHGYIPICAVQEGKTERAVASDINKGPVKRAEQNVRRFGLQDKISLRLGAGLETVAEGEADTIVIAGMGGILIANILEDSQNVVNSAKTLILQPMTAAKELREYLSQKAFTVANEFLVAEEDKIYNIMVVSVGGSTDFSERELFLGKGTENTSPELFDEYKNRIIHKFEKKLNGLQKSGREKNKAEILETEHILEILK